VVSADVDYSGAMVEYREGWVELEDLEAAVEAEDYEVSCTEEQ